MTSSPVGLHRVLEPAGVLPQAAWRLDADPDAARPTRCGSGSSGSTSTPRRFRQLPSKHGGDGDARPRRGARDRRRPAARCRTRSPAPAACSSASSRRSARTRRSACRSGDRVATLVSLTLTPLRDHRRPRPLGRPVASRCRATGTRSSSAARSPPCCPTTCPTSSRWPSWTSCGAPALTARVVERLRRRTGRPDGRGDRRGGQDRARCPWPPPDGAGRRRTVGVVPTEARARAARRAPGWPTTSRSPTPATRSPWPRP